MIYVRDLRHLMTTNASHSCDRSGPINAPPFHATFFSFEFLKVRVFRIILPHSRLRDSFNRKQLDRVLTTFRELGMKVLTV
jgi:hypothetical protein